MSGEHVELMQEAIAAEAGAQRAALQGDWDAARRGFRDAARSYRASWAVAPPGSYGRLIGALKASVEAGAGEDEARDALAEIAGAGDASPAAAYVRALASVVVGDDAEALRSAEAMRASSDAFGRAADGIAAVAHRDVAALQRAVEAIAGDFAAREQHLTGVPFADTALMLELIGRRRGLEVEVQSPLLPALP